MGQRGAAMVETALIFVTLLSTIIFIMDMGRMLLTQQYLMERARTSVRAAVVNNWTIGETQNYVAYGSIDAPLGGNTTPGLLGLLPSQVTLTQYADSGVSDARYQITIQGLPMFLWVPGLTGRYNAPPVVATMPSQSLGASN